MKPWFFSCGHYQGWTKRRISNFCHILDIKIFVARSTKSTLHFQALEYFLFSFKGPFLHHGLIYSVQHFCPRELYFRWLLYRAFEHPKQIARVRPSSTLQQRNSLIFCTYLREISLKLQSVNMHSRSNIVVPVF